MLGLTKREQRWAAQERGLEMIFALMAKKIELEHERLKNENLRLEKEVLELK